MTITIPQRLRLKEVLETAREIRDLPEEGEILIDFSNMNVAGPFALLMLSSAMSRVRNAKPKLRLQPRNYAHHSYFGHMKANKAPQPKNMPVTIRADSIVEGFGRGQT